MAPPPPQVFDVAPEGLPRALPPAAPALNMAYPRCLLAGTKDCALTLTLDGPIHPPYDGPVRVFARHYQGAFLGRTSDDGYKRALACATTALSGDALLEEELFFDLDAPDTPGLIVFECEHEGGLLGNWKPVSLLAYLEPTSEQSSNLFCVSSHITPHNHMFCHVPRNYHAVIALDHMSLCPSPSYCSLCLEPPLRSLSWTTIGS